METLENGRKAATKIALVNLTKQFEGRSGTVTAISDITLDIPEGKFFVIVGPSGCGKTTLLRILAGLERQTSGEVKIASSSDSRPLNSMVFQGDALLPWMTLRDNVAYGLKMRRVPRSTIREVVDRYLDMTGLRDFADAYPHQVSGGMRQRASIARAFSNDPDILLMDEPFSQLDEQNRLLLQQELLRIWEESRKTVVFITHSVDEAIALGDTIMVMTARPGRVKSLLDVPFDRPRDVFRMRVSKQYVEFADRIWHELRTEVDRARLLEEKKSS
jgi:NitT/TauT family transport system ATP-binding protein